MDKNSYITSVKDMVPELLKLVNDSCYNRISPNLLYITTEISLSVQTSFKEEKQYYKKVNLKKSPRSFDEAIKVIDNLYSDLYDVNLFLYKSCRRYTIIEIRYLLKSSFHEDYHQKIKDYSPMLHAKTERPFYIDTESKEKYDANWQHSLIKHPLKILLWRLKYRIGIKYSVNLIIHFKSPIKSFNYLTEYSTEKESLFSYSFLTLLLGLLFYLVSKQ